MTAAPEIQPDARRPRPLRGCASGKDDYLRRLRKILNPSQAWTG
jgi:hypothetical protein